jgi:hypothetical protein
MTPDSAPAPEGTQAPALTEAIATVVANDLFREYGANEVAADPRYKGRTITLIGAVRSIDKDFTDDIVLALESPNQFVPVRAQVHSNSARAAAALSKGSVVNLVCRVQGRIVGSPSLRDCLIR